MIVGVGLSAYKRQDVFGTLCGRYFNQQDTNETRTGIAVEP